LLVANSNIARQHIFTDNGLQWKDYDEDVANDMLEEILLMNRTQHGHEDSRKMHPRIPALSTYFYVVDHGATTTRVTKDEETLVKTGDIKKKADFEAIGLISSSSSAIKAKQEVFIEKKQLQAAALKIKVLQYQGLKVSTELAVQGRDSPTIQADHDQFDKVIKVFNEFSISISIGIAEIEGSEGEHIILYIYIYISQILNL